MAASIAVVDEEGHTLLVDASPDLRHQEEVLLSVPAYARRPGTAPVVDGIVITHGHIGHYLGLAQFGREAAATAQIPCHVTQPTAGFLVSNAPWRQLIEAGHLALHVHGAPVQIDPWDGLSIELIKVPHRDDYTDTVAVSVNGDLLYVPDIDRWDDWDEAHATVARHRVSLLDGTFWDAGEIEGRSIGDISHPLVSDTLRRFSDLTDTRRIILTHLNHTNPIADPASPEAAEVIASGFEIAFDGLVVDL